MKLSDSVRSISDQTFKFFSKLLNNNDIKKEEETMSNKPPFFSEGSAEKVTTVIAEDLEIRGTMKFKSSLMIKGIFEGEVISEGLLIVGPTAKVAAAIITKNLVSHGEVQGDVTASEQVILKNTAVHTGNITTPNIVIESGSIFNGSCIMEKNASAAAKLSEWEEEASKEPTQYADTGDETTRKRITVVNK
ncbi:MAG: polymer-forming cytoskeletal protein [Thermodesulfobacteriota bacterium]|jgi:cytoskeletal protein CcmA (bactofilin family)